MENAHFLILNKYHPVLWHVIFKMFFLTCVNLVQREVWQLRKYFFAFCLIKHRTIWQRMNWAFVWNIKGLHHHKHLWPFSKSKFNLKSDCVNLVAPASPIECLLYLPNVRAIQYKVDRKVWPGSEIQMYKLPVTS